MVAQEAILIFDPERRGHHYEYLKHLIVCAPGFARRMRKVIYSSPQLHERLEALASKYEGFEIISHSGNQDIGGIGFSFRRTVEKSVELHQTIQRVRPKVVFLPHINHYLLYIFAARALNPQVQFSGIYFQPYFRVPRRSGLKCFWGRIRKAAPVCTAAINRNLKGLFVLNEEWLERYQGKNGLFMFLVDPVNPTDGIEPVRRPKTQKASDKKRVLFIGSIERRKGILQALKAMEQLSEASKKRVELRIVGEIKGDIEAVVRKEIQRLTRAGCRITARNHYLDERDFSREVSECDVLLMPYLVPLGSSGLLNYAAIHGKPVIGPESGLVGDLIRKYQFGAVVNPHNIVQLAAAMDRLAGEHEAAPRRKAHGRFLRDRKPEVFAGKIYAHLKAILAAGATEDPKKE